MHRLCKSGVPKTKLQSAMEYLMTYGWAILVIAVVLGVLYSLGIFNPSSFAPKAQPGSCQVFRPNGPGTSYDLNLEGTCDNSLPQYTATFNGRTSYVSTGITFPNGDLQENFTVSFWSYVNGNCQSSTFYCGVLDSDNGTNGWGIMQGPANIDFWIVSSVSGGIQDMEFRPPAGKWNNVVVTYWYSNGQYFADGYVNGAIVSSNVLRSPIKLPLPYPLQIGMARQSPSMVFNGSISNVQLYNASLGPASVNAIYAEGIGGAPLNLQYLVAWYPLNGNANDYSGNGYAGTSGNVVYSGSWSYGYTPP